jgi:hypothetical protein
LGFAANEQLKFCFYLQKGLPALIAFARNKDGIITGCQRLVLDPKTANKALVDMPKKSLGSIAGSFVNINRSRANPNVTIIAEGIETALSLKQAGCDANIVCSLGISNIKNYAPSKNERIIIAADNDGPDALSNITTSQAASHLAKLCAIRVVRPNILGDFNDMLRKQDLGAIAIKQLFEPILADFAIKSLDELLAEKPATYLQSHEQLVDSLNHLQQNKIWSDEELITNLKSQTDVKDFAHITIRACQTHHYAKVCQNVNKLFDERHLNIHGKEFDCPLEYIKHEIAKPAQYTCPQRLGAKLAQVNAHMQQQELARSLEHHMHGP